MSSKEMTLHPEDERTDPSESGFPEDIELDTYGGKIHVEWQPDAAVTPLGQLPFFIEFLKLGHRFAPWVADCPLHYCSNNASKKVDVLGSLLLSVLSGHKRYARMATLAADTVNPPLLGMRKVVSDDSARRALKRLDATQAETWMRTHLYACYEPLLSTPWILDIDVTIKPLYGHQEGAKVGYNPKKPGRPSHTYHTYMMGNVRLVLEVAVKAGTESASSYSLPGLMAILARFSAEQKPAFVRGDCDWGNERAMADLEGHGYRYLFKLRQSPRVKALINQYHGVSGWSVFKDNWEARESTLQLQGWSTPRRVVVVRRRPVVTGVMLAVTYAEQQQLSLLEGPEDLKRYEYGVLVTNLESEVVSLLQHYRDRADCENVFDEIKNQWGWAGFTTRSMTACGVMARLIALVYNWWTLYVRLAHPDTHWEAVTSRPLLLSSVGRMTASGRQKTLCVTSSHQDRPLVEKICHRIGTFFNHLKKVAPQLSPSACWELILRKALEYFYLHAATGPPRALPAPT